MAAYSYKEVFYRDDFIAERERMEAAGEWDDDDTAGHDGSGWYAAAALLEAKDTTLREQQAEIERKDVLLAWLRMHAKWAMDGATIFVPLPPDLVVQEKGRALDECISAALASRAEGGSGGDGPAFYLYHFARLGLEGTLGDVLMLARRALKRGLLGGHEIEMRELIARHRRPSDILREHEPTATPAEGGE